MEPSQLTAFKFPIAGLTRGVSLIFSKVMRVRRIDAALKMLPDDSLAKTALSDYETYLAAMHGQYGVDVAAFHQELLKSGVVDAIFEGVIIDRESESLKISFSEIFYQFFPTSQDYAPLYDQIRVALKASLSELVSDKALLRFVQGFYKQINNRFDQIDSSLLARSASQKPDNIRDIISAISRGLLNHYKSLKVETLSGGARNVNIADIYVPPSLQLSITSRQAASYSEVVPNDEIEIHRAHGRIYRQRSANDLRQMSYADLRSSFRRVVVLGDPGGGKSTLCQRLCFDLARASTLVSQYQGSQSHIEHSEQRIPFRVTLRLFEQSRTANPQLDIITYIVRDLRHHVNHSEAEIYEAVVYLLNTGRGVLAFDGLDEILDTSKRREYVDLVSALCNLFPLCPALVTSRLVGYDTAPLPNDFDRIVLKKFEESEIKLYAEKFFRHIGTSDKDDAKEEADRFLFQTKENASDLRRNPLMLGLMLWIFAAKGDVPSNRPAIYSECATLMFDKWDANRGIKPLLPGGFDRAQLFSGIAARVYPEANLRAGVPKDWLQEHLIAYFSDKFVDKARAFDAAESLVNFLIGRAWVMMEVGDGVFAFTHQTFLEFFYAKHVASQFDGVPRLFRAIRSSVSKKEQDVVNHLALQIKTSGVDRLQAEAISEIRRYNEQLSKPASRQALMAFAAKSLEYLTPSESAIRDLMSDIYEYSVQGKNPDQSILPLAVSSCNLMRCFAVAEAERLIVRDITGNDDARARASLRYLVSINRAHWNNPDASLLPVAAIANAIRSTVEASAGTSIDWAQGAFSLYGMLTADMIAAFGLDTFQGSSLVTGFEGISGLEGIVLAATDRYKSNYCSVEIHPSVVQASLRVIGEVGFATDPGSRGLLSSDPFSGIPIKVWTEILKELIHDPELWRGALFVLGHSGVLSRHLVMSSTHVSDVEYVMKRLKLDEKRLEGWDGLTPEVRRFINGGAPGLDFRMTSRGRIYRS